MREDVVDALQRDLSVGGFPASAGARAGAGRPGVQRRDRGRERARPRALARGRRRGDGGDQQGARGQGAAAAVAAAAALRREAAELRARHGQRQPSRTELPQADTTRTRRNSTYRNQNHH